jgi:transposase InsO family protein
MAPASTDDRAGSATATNQGPVNGHATVALIDSGSPITSIHEPFARRLRLPERAASPLRITFGDGVATASSGVVAAAHAPAPMPPSVETIRTHQRADSACAKIRDLLTRNPRSDEEKQRARHYQDVDGVIYFLPDPAKSEDRRIVVPLTLRLGVLYAFHDHPLAGHMGVRRTYDRIRRLFHWDALHDDVREYVGSCTKCAQSKPRSNRAAGKLSPIKVSAPFELVGMDIMGPLPESGSGNRYIVVAVDYLTRWCEVSALRAAKAEDVARFFLDRVVAVHGCPKRILSDNASNFAGEVAHHMFQTLGVSISHSTPYHPETNGLVERLNRMMKTMLAMYISQHQRDWDTYLPFLTFAYRSATQESLGVSPFEALFGRKPALPADIVAPSEAPRFSAPAEWQRTLQRRLEIIREQAAKQQLTAQQRQQRNHDAPHAPSTFKEKDHVVIEIPQPHEADTSKKLMPRFSRPHELIKKTGPLTFLARELGTSNPMRRSVHVSQLKLILPRASQTPMGRGSDVARVMPSLLPLASVLS